MTPANDPTALLDAADRTLAKLARACCDPGRSPQMERLAATLGEARRGLGGSASDGGVALFAALTDAGAQVGVLQVMCCTESRMPLYHRLLDQLTAIQLAVAAQ
jgi:hypothetical protein